jgi:hypothetical protein
MAYRKAKNNKSLPAKRKSQITMPDLYIPEFTPYDCLEVDNTGTPRKWRTPEELQTRVKAFFDMCFEKGVHPTVTGLAIFLESCRQTLLNYKNDGAFGPILKRAKELCSSYLEQRAISGSSVAGEIFLLKANHQYKEEASVRVNVSLDVDKLYSQALRKAQNDSPKLIESAAKRIDNVELSE